MQREKADAQQDVPARQRIPVRLSEDLGVARERVYIDAAPIGGPSINSPTNAGLASSVISAYAAGQQLVKQCSSEQRTNGRLESSDFLFPSFSGITTKKTRRHAADGVGSRAKHRPRALSGTPGTQFTCFTQFTCWTGTKVQALTQELGDTYTY